MDFYDLSKRMPDGVYVVEVLGTEEGVSKDGKAWQRVYTPLGWAWNNSAFGTSPMVSLKAGGTYKVRVAFRQIRDVISPEDPEYGDI